MATYLYVILLYSFPLCISLMCKHVNVCGLLYLIYLGLHIYIYSIFAHNTWSYHIWWYHFAVWDDWLYALHWIYLTHALLFFLLLHLPAISSWHSFRSCICGMTWQTLQNQDFAVFWHCEVVNCKIEHPLFVTVLYSVLFSSGTLQWPNWS